MAKNKKSPTNVDSLPGKYISAIIDLNSPKIYVPLIFKKDSHLEKATQKEVGIKSLTSITETQFNGSPRLTGSKMEKRLPI